MLLLIESKDEIASSQRKLEATMRRDFTTEATKTVGFPGGNTVATVVTDGKYWYCSSDYEDKTTPVPRRLNWFGLFVDRGSLEIAVEINIPYEGRHDRVGGFFARDSETGSIYLMHSGRVGGGTKGVGKSAFLAWCMRRNERPLEVVDSAGQIRTGMLVMPIEGIAASRPATRYIDTIVSFKQAVRNGETALPAFQREKQELEEFFAEPRGRRTGRRSEEIDYLSRHGAIVDALYSWRSSSALPPNGRLVKSILIDMGVAVGQDLVEVFEVKTSVARSSIYAAIGQLMVHGTSDQCRRVIVLPRTEGLAPHLESALHRLNVEVLRFELDEMAARIL